MEPNRGGDVQAFDDVVTDLDQLGTLYRSPRPNVLAKVIDHLDDGCQRFIAASRFVAVGTVSSSGVGDVSPRGGPAGFVKVLDAHRIALPDLNGNNRLDTLRNIVQNPAVGLLFVIPGRGEALRVNGRAVVTTDGSILDQFTEEVRRPVTAIGVEVHTAFLHCAKAFRRGVMWDPDRWPAPDVAPSAAAMFRDHLGLSDLTVETVEAQLEASYVAGLEADRPVPST